MSFVKPQEKKSRLDAIYCFMIIPVLNCHCTKQLQNICPTLLKIKLLVSDDNCSKALKKHGLFS